MRRDAFQGIADPTRRSIIQLLAGKTLTVNAVADQFEVSRTAIYKHLKILSQCGLVVVTQHGRERLCSAHLQNLGEVAGWIEPYRKVWEARLDSLEEYLGKIQEKENPKKK